MPAYLVKITTHGGLVKPPLVVNNKNEEEVMRLLTERGDDGDVIEIVGPPPHPMSVAFGSIPEGSGRLPVRLDLAGRRRRSPTFLNLRRHVLETAGLQFPNGQALWQLLHCY